MYTKAIQVRSTTVLKFAQSKLQDSLYGFSSFVVRLSLAALLILGLGFIADLQAQNNEVSGTVTDQATGDSLPGVNISIVGTTTGTTTDGSGSYSLMVSSLSDTLRFSFVGYETRTVPINGRTTVDVALQSEAITGDEVIVTGYTSQRRDDITSAISSADMESISKQTSTSVLQRLDGRVSGVTVETSGSPGSRNTVRIRGISSFQNNDPLYIIDGTPIQDSFANWLNPDDIESIQVLKDASAASIYGSRANNGVIIIETKKGGPGGVQVSLDVRSGVATPTRGYDDFLIQDALEYHEVVKRAYENAGEPVPTNIYGDADDPSIPNYIWPNDPDLGQTNDLSAFEMTEDDYAYPNNLIMPASSGTNWWDAVFGNGFVQDYNLGISGGSEDYNYHVSLNYLDQEGTAAYNRFQRGSIRVNTEFDVGILTVGENLSVALDESFGGISNDAFGEGNILGKNILSQPVVPIYDIAGNFASGKAVGLGNNSNPLKQAYTNKDDINRNTRLFGNVYGRFDIVETVSVTSRLGFNLVDNSSTGFTPMNPENSEPTFNESINESNSVTTEWTWSNTLNYVDSFAEHNVNLLIGQEANEVNFRGLSGQMSGLLNNNINSRYIQDALGDPSTKNVTSSGFKASLLSFFGKVDYNYDERYHLSVTLRRDGSSNLGPNNQWGTFPAFSAGWRISNESFLQDNDLFSDIMLRAGWGITGNQNIPAGSTVSQYGGNTGDTFYDITGSHDSIEQGYRQTVIGNPDLKWEENESVNIGADLEMFDGRFNFALDVYQRNTNDLLFSPNLPATAGIANPPVVNIGKMQNTGLDFTVGTRGSIGDDVNWTLRFNGSHYQNEIVRIDGEQDFFFGPIETRFGNQVINQVGRPLGAFYGLLMDGYFQNDAEVNNHAAQDGAAPGRIRFRDLNGDGAVTADDRTVIGDPHPDFTGGLDIGVQWKSWDFSTTIFGTFGNDIFDVQKEFYVFRNFSTNVRRDLLTDSWTPDNPDAKYPQIDVSDTFSYALSDFYVEDGSYVRLRNLQIGYTVPVELLPGIRNMRVYVQGENLFTITGYDGLDPSLPAANVSNRGADIRDQYRGVDRGVYPSNRTISIGINASF